MAEEVQAILDGMVAPLANLQERAIFTPQEIAATVARRRESEYRLQRQRKPRLSDYLEYVETEEKLELLRRVRVKRIERFQKRNNEEEQLDTTLGDKHILQHLHRTWTRTLQKFRTTPELYFQYAACCERLHTYHRLTHCYQEALAFFGRTHAQLWVDAAQHEMIHNQSVGAARVLLQRGLRTLGKNSDCFLLYRASFVLELHWVQKLKGRKMILLPDDNNNTDEYKIAKIVYRNAMKDTNAEPLWSWQFLEACQGFPAADLEAYILDHTVQEKETNPSMWMARVRYLASCEQKAKDDDHHPAKKRARVEDEAPSSTTTKCLVLDILREACQKVPTVEMYESALEFLADSDEDEAASDLIQQLLTEISTHESLQTPALLLQYIDSLADNNKEAIAALERFTKQHPSCAMLWIEWARRVYNHTGSITKAQQILHSTTIPLSEPDYVTIAVQLLGLHLLDTTKPFNFDLLERILLLSPANPLATCTTTPLHAECRDLPSLCVQVLHHVSHDLPMVRKVYQAVLSCQCWASSWIHQAPDSLQAFLDRALELETTTQQAFLYERAIASFKGTPAVVRDYRQRRDDMLRYRHGDLTTSTTTTLPTVDFQAPHAMATLQELYNKFQVCIVKNVQTNEDGVLEWTSLCDLYAKLDTKDQDSWCVETKGTNGEVNPLDFLSKSIHNRAYCSFLVQKDQQAYNDVVERLPVATLCPSWQYEPALWFFFGRNTTTCDGKTTPLPGRPEHTDSVSHDGTWHYQLAGTKRWFLRPTPELLDRKHFDPMSVLCEQGDVIVINTRIWFHRTEIPAQPNPSVSYARDFSHNTAQINNTMTNVEGTYATEFIPQGTILFTESEMPNGELHRAHNKEHANCRVCVLEEDGTTTHAVVAVHDIQAGEFFCIPDTDDESGTDESGDEESGDADEDADESGDEENSIGSETMT